MYLCAYVLRKGMRMVREKVPVSLRAVLQRINRKLAKEEEVLKKTRGQAALADVGAYYVLNWRRNTIEQWHVDPTTLAQQLGALAGWETVKEDA
jgi:hypothetical protein